MINELKYIKLKSILEKEFLGKRVHIHICGIVTTSIVLDNTQITINKNKVILLDENNQFELEFLMVNKIKFDEKWHIQIFFEEFKITLEV